MNAAQLEPSRGRAGGAAGPACFAPRAQRRAELACEPHPPGWVGEQTGPARVRACGYELSHVRLRREDLVRDEARARAEVRPCREPLERVRGVRRRGGAKRREHGRMGGDPERAVQLPALPARARAPARTRRSPRSPGRFAAPPPASPVVAELDAACEIAERARVLRRRSARRGAPRASAGPDECRTLDQRRHRACDRRRLPGRGRPTRPVVGASAPEERPVQVDRRASGRTGVRAGVVRPVAGNDVQQQRLVPEPRRARSPPRSSRPVR